MQAGKLRHRLQFQSGPGTTVDSYGEVIPSWSTYATVWGSVEPLSGRELLRAQELQSDITTRVRARYLAAATPDDRIVHDSRTLEIVVVLNKGDRNIELELMCKEAAT